MERTSTKRSRLNPKGETDDRWRQLLLKILYLGAAHHGADQRLLARPDVRMHPIRASTPTSPASSSDHREPRFLEQAHGGPRSTSRLQPGVPGARGHLHGPGAEEGDPAAAVCRCQEPLQMQQYTGGCMNHKRLFWKCSKKRDKACKTFKWLETQPFCTRSGSRSTTGSKARCSGI